MSDEVETAAAAPAFMQHFDIGFGEIIIDVGNTAIGTTALGDSVEDRVVVDAVTAGIDQYGTGQTEYALQFLEIVEAGMGGV